MNTNLAHDSTSGFYSQYFENEVFFRGCSHLTWLLFVVFYLNSNFSILFYFNLIFMWMRLALLFNISEHIILLLQMTLSKITLFHQIRLGALLIWVCITLLWQSHHLGQFTNTFIHKCVCIGDHLITFGFLINILPLQSSQIINSVRAEPNLLFSLLFLLDLAPCLTHSKSWTSVDCCKGT